MSTAERAIPLTLLPVDRSDLSPIERHEPGAAPLRTLIDLYLDRQQQLTAVERLSAAHEADSLPSQAKYYATLLPATPPGPGEQYAFEVDLDRCSGCKACVTACHQLNGLDERETWRDVGLLHGGTVDEPVIQHVTSACHHCLEPACLNVCPVDAYEKDGSTGIVKHLDDQCIGCQYCTLACPYDVPQYHREKGIVRKCDLCSDRLASGEAPACVQSCPNEAIRVTVVAHQAVIESSETNLFLPGAPEPQYTLPTTVYKTRRVLPRNLLPADYYSVKPEHAHWPLVVMLVLTQLSVGAFVVEFALDALASPRAAARGLAHATGALFFGLLALTASTCHLGRPLYAFRAVIGLRHSWLSREIVAFGLFAPLAAAYAGTIWLAPPGADALRNVEQALRTAVVLTGLTGVFCSIMIYQCTRRALWNGADTAFKFLSSMLLLGTAAALGTSTFATFRAAEVPAALAAHGELLCRTMIVLCALKLLCEAAVFRHLRARQNTPLKRSALLMTGELATAAKARFTLGILGGIVLPLALVTSGSLQAGTVTTAAAVAGVFFATLVGELLERYLFFTAVVAPRMPGGLTA